MGRSRRDSLRAEGGNEHTATNKGNCSPEPCVSLRPPSPTRHHRSRRWRRTRSTRGCTRCLRSLRTARASRPSTSGTRADRATRTSRRLASRTCVSALAVLGCACARRFSSPPDPPLPVFDPQARCVETIRLLSLCSLASGNKTLSYDAIASTLQVSSTRMHGARHGARAKGQPPIARDDHFEFLVKEGGACFPL